MSEFFAAPNGTPSGDGSQGNPWNLDTALGSYDSAGRVQPPSSIQSGDTLWLRGGTYVPASDNGFFAHLTSSDASKPVIVRNYRGERATLLCSFQAFVLSAESANVWYWGLEGACSGAPRASNTGGGANPLAYGFRMMAPGVKFINCIVHDTAQGFSGYNAASDTEIYGCLSYYNGWRAPDRPHGHNFYIQNATGSKNIENCIAFDACEENMQCYGSGGAFITGVNVRRNAMANAGSVGDGQFKYNFILGGGQLNTLNLVEDNDFFFDITKFGDAAGGYLNFGQYTKSTSNKFRGNNCVGGNVAFACEGAYGPLEVTGNRVYTDPSATTEVRLGQTAGDNRSQFTWDNNSYYGNGVFMSGEYFQDPASGNFSERNGSFQPFPAWQASTGLDAHSTYTPSKPTGKWIRVTPNKYEQKRAHVIIYNWDLSPSVDVNLTGVLSPGDQFLIQDAQNFYGSPVVSGTYSGGMVSIPMTSTTKSAPDGLGTPAHTLPLFGTFVVMAPGAANPVVGVVLSPVSVTVQINQTQQFTASTFGLAGGVTFSAQHGQVSASGLYTAPSAPTTDTLTATSTADPSKSASATLNITLAPPAPPPTTGGKVKLGDTVINHNPGATTGVRAAADIALPKIGNIPDGTLGTVLAGPTPSATADATSGKVFQMWQIAWQASASQPAITGFSVEDYLRVTVSTPGPPVPPPSTHSATLSWSASPDADGGYSVYRNGSKLASLTGLTYTDKTVLASTTYTYTVRTSASGGGSESVDSNQVTAVIPADGVILPPPPPAPLPQHTAPSNLQITSIT